MKKLLSSICILALLCGCVPKAPTDTEPDPPAAPIVELTVEKIGEMVLGACYEDTTQLEHLNETLDEETLRYYLTELYGLEEGSWSDCALYRAGGARAFEIAILRMRDDQAVTAAHEALEDYIQRREGDFTGYEPEEATIVRQAVTLSVGTDVALLICQDAAVVKEAFLGIDAYRQRIPFAPPKRDDMTLYDTSAILSAWESGDRTGLGEKDAAILALAEAVLAETISPEMSAYEKEKAIYRWITANVAYDDDHYDPLAKLSPDSSTPYGPLHSGKGICIGFAVTFQLLLDMAGVECVTIVGSSFSNGEDHAWNMVRLNGRWYCADTTWDKARDEANWAYFNCTSQWMADTDHQWDYANTPEATALDQGTRESS